MISLHAATALPKLLAPELAPLRIYFEDDQVTEIMVNPDGAVWIESAGVIFKSDLSLSEA